MEAMENLSRDNLDHLRESKKLGAGEQKAALKQKLHDKVAAQQQAHAPPAQAPPPQPKNEWTAAEASSLRKRMEKQGAEKAEAASEPRRQLKIKKLLRYKALGYCDLAISTRMSEAEADIALSHVRGTLGEKGSQEMVDKALSVAALCFEKATHEYGLNPANLSVHDLGTAVAGGLKDERFRKQLMPELHEAYVEIGSAFATPWYARLAAKLGEFVLAYSGRQKQLIASGRSSRSVDPSSLPPMPPPPGPSPVKTEPATQ